MSKTTAYVFAIVILLGVIIGGIVLTANNRANADTGSSETSQDAVPEKNATNVEIFKIPGAKGFSEGVIVFDIERDGQILTCTTKQNYNSGVGCVKK